MEADDLNDFEKLLFSEIYTMANSFGSIFPSNAYLAKRYGKTTWTVSTTLKKLQEKGYIKMEYEFEGKEVKKRYIYPYLDLSNGGIVKNLNTPSEKSKGGIVENLKDNISTNKSINISNNNISNKSDKESDLEDRFDNLWKIYPNKKGKPRALLAYKRALKSGTTDEEIKTGLENYLEEIRVKNTQQNYIKHSIDGSQDFTPGYPNLNLLDGTKDFSGTWNNSTLWTDDGTYNGLKVRKRTAAQRGTYKTWTVPNDGIYTFSCYVKSSGPNAKVHGAFQVNGIREVDRTFGDDFDWKRDSLTRTLKAGDSIVYSYEMAGSAVDSTIWVAGYKIEPGLTATPYMPSSSEVTTADYPQYKYVGRMAGLNVSDKNDPKNYMWQTNTDVVRDDSGKVFVTRIETTSDVRTWTPITLSNVTSAILMYQIINGVIHLNGQGNWGSFTANQSKTVATLPAELRPTRTVNKVITTQNTNNNDKPMEIQIQEGGNINIWSMPASTSGRYGGFEESYPLG